MSVSEIGRRLKKARLDAGLTQKEVAKKLGITYQAISNYERGTNRVDTDTLTRLCQIYEIKIHDLLTTPAWTEEMLQAYHNAASVEEKDYFLELWGIPLELIEEVNNRREPEQHLLTAEDELVLYRYHNEPFEASQIPSINLIDAEIDMIRKFRCLDSRGQAAVLNVLNYEFESLAGEKADSPAKEA